MVFIVTAARRSIILPKNEIRVMMDLIKSESGNWMDNNNYKTAKILILIPIIVFVITVIAIMMLSNLSSF